MFKAVSQNSLDSQEKSYKNFDIKLASAAIFGSHCVTHTSLLKLYDNIKVLCKQGKLSKPDLKLVA